MVHRTETVERLGFSVGFSARFFRQGKNFRKLDQQRNPVPLTNEVMRQHWQGKITIGLYAADAHDMVKCLSFDLDNHEGIPLVGVANSNFLRQTCEKLSDLGFSFIAHSSDDKGGYHCRIPFVEKIPYQLARAFGCWLVKDFAGNVELFPKASVKHTNKKCGNYIRLILPKPGKTAYPEFWTGKKWIWANTVDEAVDFCSRSPATILHASPKWLGTTRSPSTTNCVAIVCQCRRGAFGKLLLAYTLAQFLKTYRCTRFRANHIPMSLASRNDPITETSVMRTTRVLLVPIGSRSNESTIERICLRKDGGLSSISNRRCCPFSHSRMRCLMLPLS